jgi:peptidoglycan lytic transglycosylase
MTFWEVALLGGLCVVVTGCASASRGPSGAAGSRVPATPAPPSAPGVQTGKASWYGDAHQGRKTASGEIYDMHTLTAAHRTLPFGTRVRVTNVDNGRSVVVRVNDRGPFPPGRLIDVSRAAALELGVIGAGLFTVRIEILENAAAEPPSTPRSR